MNKQTEALKMAIEALDDIELCDYQTQQKAIQACKEALEPQTNPEFDVVYYNVKQPAQEYLTRAQQVIRANNSAQEHCVNLKMDKCEHKNICEHCTHPAPSEPFIGGSVCPSCGNHSLFKTDKSEWCVTHKCLWQSDYPPSWQGLSDDEIYKQIEKASIPQYQGMDVTATNLITFARAIEQALKEKNT